MLLEDKLKDYSIILCSKSPRRKELLTNCGIEFTMSTDYDVEEVYPKDLPAYNVAEYLSELKAEGYPNAIADNEILITADTVVILGDRVLGKAKTRDEAIEMLTALSGNSHEVVTGVTFRGKNSKSTFSSTTRVWFRSVTEEEIVHYVDKYIPYDKAGSYGIQEWIGYVAIERIDGSFYNVMGLPIQQLYVNLTQFIKTI